MSGEAVHEKHWYDELTRQEEYFVELLRNKQRVEGIVSLCGLDNKLEKLLRKVMIDDKDLDKLMAAGGRLKPFSVKVKLAYALGLIPKAIKEDLTYINRIRNRFAHDEDTVSFDKSPICNWCKELSTAKTHCINPPDAIDLYRLAVLRSLKFLDREVREKATTTKQRQQEFDAVQSRYEEMGEGI